MTNYSKRVEGLKPGCTTISSPANRVERVVGYIPTTLQPALNPSFNDKSQSGVFNPSPAINPQQIVGEGER